MIKATYNGQPQQDQTFESLKELLTTEEVALLKQQKVLFLPVRIHPLLPSSELVLELKPD